MTIESQAEGLLFNDDFSFESVKHEGKHITFVVRVYKHEEFLKFAQQMGIEKYQLTKSLFFNQLDYTQNGERVPFFMGAFSEFYCADVRGMFQCLQDFTFRCYGAIYKGARIDMSQQATQSDFIAQMGIGIGKILAGLYGLNKADEAQSSQPQGEADEAQSRPAMAINKD